MTTVPVLPLLDPVVGMVALAVGTFAWWRRRTSLTGPLLVLTGVLWFAGAVVPTLALLHRGPLVHTLVTYPTGRPGRPVERVAVLLGWLLAVWSILGSSPTDAWSALLLALLLGVVALGRPRARPPHPRAAPAGAAMAVVATVLVLAGINLLADLDADLGVAVAYDVAVAVAVAVLGGALLPPVRAADALADLSAGTALESRLREALGDPSLRIGYWSAAPGTFLDERGDPLPDIAPGVAETLVRGPEGPVAVLRHAAPLRAEPGLLEGATAAVRLSVANAELRREARERVGRFSQARRRLVEAADTERALLSQRLSAPRGRLRRTGDLLAEVKRAGCGDPGLVDALRAESSLASQDLDRLAHGVRPPSLTTGGLGAALPALTARCPVPVTLSVDVGRLAPALEAGLYFFCAEGLANAAKHSSASTVQVSVWTEGTGVVAEVLDDGVGGADARGSGLRGLADRIAALGGTVEVGAARLQGTRLVARVPVGRKGRA